MTAKLSRLGNSQLEITIGDKTPHVAGRPDLYNFAYDPSKLIKLLEQIEEKRARLKEELSKLSSRSLLSLNLKNVRREAYYSSFIEDEVTLKTEPELERIWQGRFESLSDAEAASYTRALDAIVYARGCTEQGGISEAALKEIQRRVVTDPNLPAGSDGNEAGQYRTSDNTKVKSHGNVGFVPPVSCKLQSLMNDYFGIDSSMIENDLERAGVIQMVLGLIHPFADGNGRTIRPAMTDALNSEPILTTNGINYRLMDFLSLSEGFCDGALGGFRHGYLAWLNKVTNEGYKGGNFNMDPWMNYFVRVMDKSQDVALQRVEQEISPQASVA